MKQPSTHSKTFLIIAALAAALVYALLPSSRNRASTETFTVDNLVAQTSVQLNSANASKILATDGSKKFTTLPDVSCAGGSAITAVTGTGFTCAAVSGGGGGGLFNGTMSSTIPTQSGLGFSNWHTDAGGSFSDVDQGILFNFPTGSTSSFSAITAAAPATPYTVTATLTYGYSGAGNSGNWGIGWTAGTSGTSGTTTGQWLIYCPACSGGFQQRIFNITSATSVASFVNQSASIIRVSGAGVPWFLRLKDDGTTVTYSISFDGISYTTVYSVAKASGFLGAGGYSRIGFGVNDMSAGPSYVALLSWKITSP